MKSLRKRVAAFGIAAVATVGTLIGTAPGALAASGTVKGTGGCLAVRTGPGVGYQQTGCLPDGTPVNVVCQTSGDTVSGHWGRTNLWDRFADGRYASDGFIDTGSNGRVAPECGGNNGGSRADQAVSWYTSRNGSTAYEWRCETAAENAYGATGKYYSAMTHWQAMVNSGHAHPGDTNPPKGAFVYWNIAQPDGHVGVADGAGGVWATNVNYHIGHAPLTYFKNYLGWSDVTF